MVKARRPRPLRSFILITDEGSELNGWLKGLEGERVYETRTSTTSNLCVTYDHCSVIVLTKTDTPSSAWLAIEAARTKQLDALTDSAELEICLVIAPSHGALNGAMVWCVRPSRAVSLLDGFHVIDWIRDAVARGFNRVHFHTCCIASSLVELGKSSPNIGDSVVVTAFKGEIKWSSEGPSTADQWFLQGFTRGSAPLGDGWRCALQVTAESVTLAAAPQRQGRLPRKKRAYA